MAKTKKVKRKPKVFVDSSVLIAASISSKGSARDLLYQGLQANFILYISDVVLEESERNILLKAPNALEDFGIFKKYLETNLVEVNRSKILKIAKIVERKDAPIVAGAVTAKADYLVTYDRKHLLQYKKDIRESFKIKVITPDELI